MLNDKYQTWSIPLQKDKNQTNCKIILLP
jgi:hypothetical protein